MSETPGKLTPIEVFCSYAEADEALYKDLATHLALLRNQGRISLVASRQVIAGTDWKTEMDERLESSALILLLISPSFMASDYCYGVEMKRALERQRVKQAIVVPVLLRPTDWLDAPFAHLSPLPSNKKFIVEWDNKDSAFYEVAVGLRGVIEHLPTLISPFPPLPQLKAIVQPVSTPTVAVKTATVQPFADAAEMLRVKREAEAFDVFLCHHGIDKPAVKEIAAQLEAQGILPWLDEWELPPGVPWQPLLEKQIGLIKSAAVFVGKSGIGPWQEQELYAFLREFVDRHCPVIPVLLFDASKEPDLPVFLKAMTWVDFRKVDPDPLGQLAWGITGQRPKRR